MEQVNIIKSINGQPISAPSSLKWSWNDVSKSTAGRTEDGLMHKERIATKRKLELSWKNITLDVAIDVLTKTSDEYFNVEFFDLKEGKFITRNFYRGDPSGDMYEFNEVHKIISNLSFNIIER